ncbi:MAG: sll1863 family stress response protein [Candidatus Aminicenantales bacterium]
MSTSPTVSARRRKLGLEARLDFEKGLKSLEKTEKDLKVKMGEWAKAGGQAGADMKTGLERAAKELKKAVNDAASRLK